MRTAALLVLLLLSLDAAAQYKCVDAAGRVAFQQTPCAVQEKQQVLTIRATGPSTPPGAPAPATTRPVDQAASADVRMLRKMQGERRVAELERAIYGTEANIVNRNARMEQEFAALRSMKASAKNNLAGATWEQSLSTEMQAVAAKYKALNDVDQERLKLLRTDLASAQQALGKTP